ncbi:MAG: hypothetical protein C4520_07840 [Candidatus Abyssobacteria bacterium SURF_5]|uniref:Pyrrolo-quinoline quinone repeat domain-containing protein n=1 Tax=Abyssobacteria bacterium (strain SURF_5) TaxID=2093360 RepID=A0A3A4P066_ABYX5|nr:MAG: hypothetical protein C4520_07840 [Candidatus Abyssubacteria bacterium SURF_5]
MPEERQEQRLFRRKLPCANHQFIAAAAHCDICGRPICKDCIRYYGGEHICSAECWTQKIAQDSLHMFAAYRRKSKFKLGALIGLAASICLLIGLSFFFIYSKMERPGARLWELKYSPQCFGYKIVPSIDTVFVMKDDNTVQAVDTNSGKQRWLAHLPEEHKGCRLTAFDSGRAFVDFSGKLLLLNSVETRPAWEYALPQPDLSASLVFSNETLFLSSSSAGPRGGYSSRRARADSRGNRVQEGDAPASMISAVEAGTGKEIWAFPAEEVVVNDLFLVDATLYGFGERAVSLPASEEASPAGQKTENDLNAGSALLALDPHTGFLRWQTDLDGGCVLPPMPIPQGFLIATRESISLISLSGSVLWQHPLAQQTVLSLDYSDGLLFVLSQDGLLSCIEADSGLRKWMADVRLATGRLFTASQYVYVCGRREHKPKPPKTAVHNPPFPEIAGSSSQLDPDIFTLTEATTEKVLCGLDMASGEEFISRTLQGNLHFLNGAVYALSLLHWENNSEMPVDPPQDIAPLSALSAYELSTGVKKWEILIDGAASDVHVSGSVAIVKVVPLDGSDQSPRLIGFSLR